MPRASLLRYRLNPGALIVALTVAVSMVLGGGGSSAPIQEMILQVLLAALFAAWLWVLPSGKLRALPRDVWLIAGLVVALLSLVVGAGQMVGEHENVFRFYDADSGWLSGFQANHNAEADVLLLAIVACAAVAREIPVRRNREIGLRHILGVAGVIMALLSLGVVLSASRAGMALLPVALSGALVILRPIIHLTWRQTLIATGAGTVLVLGAVLVLGNNRVIAHSLERFQTIQEMRPEIWRDSLIAAGNHLPWGSGMASFTPVFGAVEPIEAVATTYTSRAHDDFLELLVEAGLVGVLWGAAILAILGRAALGSLRLREGVSRGQVVCAITILCEIGLHSLLDYPLRSMAISSIAAIAAALLILPPESSLRTNAWKEQP